MSEVIRGSLISYIYKSEDSLYKVAKIKTADEDVVIVGSFLELEEGLDYEFVGEFVKHIRYGKQFKVESYTRLQSFSKEGLIAYFSGDRFFGIGEKLATAIVETLGLDCINEIRQNPEVLNKVAKLTKAKQKVIVETLNSNYALEQTMLKLYSFDLSGKMISRLLDYYGTEAVVRIEENPYRLIYDVDGFGFKKCDALALKLGFAPDDPLRLKEALCYTLTFVCYQQGFTFLTAKQLLNSTVSLLKNVEEGVLEKALSELVSHGKMIKEDDRYFDSFLYNCEVECASRINKIKNKEVKLPTKAECQKAVGEVEKNIGISYTDLQVEAIVKALANKITIITGGPGTGKSTIIYGILRAYALLNKLNFPSEELAIKVQMMAPTGRASKRMTEVTGFKATTIHKALGFNYEEGFTFDDTNPLTAGLIIVDEASMIDISLARSLFKAINPSAQVVLVGDENQLPSVGPGNFLHDLLLSSVATNVKLFQIMRQATDSAIIKLANMVMGGTVDFRIFSSKKEVYFYPSDSKNLISTIYKIVDSYLEKGNNLKTGIQILIPMYAGVAGIDAVNEAMQSKYNSEIDFIKYGEFTFKTGDKVLQLKNDKDLKLMNGDIGIIKGIAKIEGKDALYIDFDGQMVTYNAKNLDNLRLAYAISIHKSQGSEYDNVILPILPSYSLMLRKKIIYTAVTRAKKKLIILGNPQTLAQAVRHIEPLRQTALCSRLVASKFDVLPMASDMPFEFFGEYDMDGITPYTFME